MTPEGYIFIIWVLTTLLAFLVGRAWERWTNG